MNKFKEYKRKVTTGLLTPWVQGFDMSRVSVSQSDVEKGSPKKGDMIATNKKDGGDLWLVERDYFLKNYINE